MNATNGRGTFPFTGKVQDWDVVSGNAAADCRILLHTSSRPVRVFAEKGITVAVGYASASPFNALRSWLFESRSLLVAISMKSRPDALRKSNNCRSLSCGGTLTSTSARHNARVGRSLR